MKILILQSSAPHRPAWVTKCMRSVEQWCILRGYHYRWIGDSLFDFTTISTLRFSKVTRSDLARLIWIATELETGSWDAVYWVDSDFLIWNVHEFHLPVPAPGSVVCAREVMLQHTGTTGICFNNSVLGFCDSRDAETLIDASRALIDRHFKKAALPRQTVIGTDLFSSRSFPLRRIVAKQAGCFSAETIRMILGPYDAGRDHLFRLSVAHGADLYGANLCHSLNTSERTMEDLVADLTHGDTLRIGVFRWISPIYRLLLRARHFPHRICYWATTRRQKIRQSLTTA